MEESTKKNLHPKLLLLTASVILVCIVALVAQIPKKKPEPQIDVTTTLEKIVKTTCFLQDMGDFAAMNEVYASYFEGAFPSRSAVEVAKLPKGGLIEIEAVAYL